MWMRVNASGVCIRKWILMTAVVGMAFLCWTAVARAECQTYTLDADFDQGLMINVNHDSPNNDQLQLNEFTSPFPFIWVACSGRGTIVRIDVNTGAILGEYKSAPQGRPLNPSRTTVDLEGNVWATNRDEATGGWGSVIKIGLVIGGTRGNKNPDDSFTPDPNGQYLAPPFDYITAVDRDGDGYIKTSRGLGNILPWPDITDGAGGTPALVEDADDECILIFQRVHSDHARHASVTANNNVWIGGNFGGDNAFDLLDGNTGTILASFDVGAGGYGGLIDGNGVIWSANRGPGPLTTLWYDTKNTISTADDTWKFLNAPNPYGLAIDGFGNVWNAQWSSNQIRKFDPNGNLMGVWGTGGSSNDRGVAVTPVDNHVWVANSGGNNVSRLNNSGGLVKVITVGSTPTGVAVDANGKVWVTCYNSHNAVRIDPNGGGDGLGAVDLTVSLGSGAYPYNYSDMTGIIALSQTAPQGFWKIVYDGGAPDMKWGLVCWNDESCATQPQGSAITARVRTSNDQVTWSAWVTVDNCVNFVAPDGQYLEVEMKLTPNEAGESPVLCDVTICTGVIDVAIDIKPQSCPNPLNIKRVHTQTDVDEISDDYAMDKPRPDIDGNSVFVAFPVAILGTPDFDVTLVDPSTVMLAGTPVVRWNYDDVATPMPPDAAECECHTLAGDGYTDLTLKFNLLEIIDVLGEVSDGQVIPLTLTGYLYDGTGIEGYDCVVIRARHLLADNPDDITDPEQLDLSNSPNPFNPATTIQFTLPIPAYVVLEIYNVTGQRVATLLDRSLEAGRHSVVWNGSNIASGIYLYRLNVGSVSAVRKMVLLK